MTKQELENKINDLNRELKQIKTKYEIVIEVLNNVRIWIKRN